jgi:hypothetical protein
LPILDQLKGREHPGGTETDDNGPLMVLSVHVPFDLGWFGIQRETLDVFIAVSGLNNKGNLIIKLLLIADIQGFAQYFGNRDRLNSCPQYV